MFKIIIENTMTIVLKDDKVMGNLLNQEGIKELVSSLPLDEIIINLNGQMMTLNREQMNYAYDRILAEKASYGTNKKSNK